MKMFATDSKTENGNEKPAFTYEKRKETNERLLNHLMNSLKNNKKDFFDMRKKILITYNVTIILYIVLFVLGILLLSVPLYYAYFKGNIAVYNSFISGGLGIIDLLLLFVFKPVERIHNLMSDISQITIIINSYQEQEALRLLEFDAKNNASIGAAAEHIGKAAHSSVNLLEKYCESQSNQKDEKNVDQPSSNK